MISIRTVLCPVDFTGVCDREIQAGVEICKRFGSRLVLEHNFDPRPPNYLAVSWMWSEEQEAREKTKAEDADRRLRALFRQIPESIEFEGKLTRGPIDLALLLVAQELSADLIVMASHGRSTPEHRSLTERIIVQAPCPVLALPPAAPDTGLFAGGEGAPVVVPVDFSAHSVAAAEFAFALAETLPVELHLVHVESGGTAAQPSAKRVRRLKSCEERLRGLVPQGREDRVTLQVLEGKAADEILSYAEGIGAALLVIGTHPKGAVRRLLTGATSREVLHRSRWPIWFLPRKEFEGVWATAQAAEQ